MKISKPILSMCLGVLFLLGSSAAHATVNVLTFEGLGQNDQILNFYNGGTSSQGNSGPNYGISFGPDSLSLTSGNYSNNPSGVTIMYFLTGPGDVMNVAAGFNTGFSFYYADQIGFTGSVDVFSGLNGTGSLLATLILPPTPNPYTVWVPVGVLFPGTAMSVVFSGAADFIGFDDVTLGSGTPGVPDGGTTVALLGMAFVGIAALKRKLA